MNDLNGLFESNLKICTCGKHFLIAYTLRGYVYKIRIGSNTFQYYCCYTCWRKATKESEDRQREIQREERKRAAKNGSK